MSGLVRISLKLGAVVSGSDRAGGRLVDQLRDLGCDLSIGHAGENVPEACELVISSAIAADNPERVRGRELGLTELHRSELLGELTRLRPTIAVTGTHGKTTTTAMVVSALRGAGLDPGWAVGADLAGGEPNAGWGSSDWFVVEADESDRSLLALSPKIAVVTNCELDHHATYASLEDLRATLGDFLELAEHAVIWGGQDLAALVPAGVESVAYDAERPFSGPDGARFGWRGRQIQLSVPGIHNAVNAAGALEAALLTGADRDGLEAGIAGFAGTGRRFERVGVTAAGALVVDDYAHHPTEVAATIAAARSLNPGRVVLAFQPHLFSRTAAFAAEFGEALAAADTGFVLDIYPARESSADFPGVDAQMLVDAANAGREGEPFSLAGGLDDAFAVIGAELQEGDLCLLLGAGDVGSLGARLVK
jgi:UDP-N-acetylmuramate--alanine ligase